MTIYLLASVSLMTGKWMLKKLHPEPKNLVKNNSNTEKHFISLLFKELISNYPII